MRLLVALSSVWNSRVCIAAFHTSVRIGVWRRDADTTAASYVTAFVYSCSLSRNVLCHTRRHCEEPDSSVGIVTGYGLDDWRVVVRVAIGSRIFSSPRLPHRLWGPPNLLSYEYGGAISPRVKLPEREADHSPSASADVKKMWIYKSILPYAVMA
jgi:hypothetical protein